MVYDAGLTATLFLRVDNLHGFTGVGGRAPLEADFFAVFGDAGLESFGSITAYVDLLENGFPLLAP